MRPTPRVRDGSGRASYGWWLSFAGVALALLLAGRSGAQDGPRFFAETGQSLDNEYGFLLFWEQHAGPELFGPPITGIVLDANVPVQYFERGRLEHRDGRATAGALGRERTRWRTFTRRASMAAGDSRRGEGAGYSIGAAFRDFWQRHDGAVVFGAPISDPLWEAVGGATLRVQYFERARLEQHGAGSGARVVVSALGREIALARGLIRPAQPPAVAIFDVAETGNAAGTFAALGPPTPTPVAPTPTPAPTLAPPPEAAEGQLIDVNLSTQSLSVWQNGALVYEAPVATGKDGFETPAGTYAIYNKTAIQTMYGSLGGESWVVPDVPHVMYFTGDVALHGAYWHNAFGTGERLSHGCVNLSLADAEWLYNWASVGTPVVVHY